MDRFTNSLMFVLIAIAGAGLAKELCNSPACQNGGKCNQLIVGLDLCQCECTCPCDYTGPCCESLLDFQNCSISNPCHENGVCIDKVAADLYDCDCPTGFDGECCQLDVNFCVEGDCMNGGTCVDGKGNLTSCICPSTYTGERCESLYCPSDYCCNGGSCKVGSATDPHQLACSCAPGFKGEFCEISIDFCMTLGSPCPAGLKCVDGIGTAIHCLCPAECCVNCTDPCSSGPCINNGTCSTIDCICLECIVSESACSVYSPTTALTSAVSTVCPFYPPSMNSTSAEQSSLLLSSTTPYTSQILPSSVMITAIGKSLVSTQLSSHPSMKLTTAQLEASLSESLDNSLSVIVGSTSVTETPLTPPVNVTTLLAGTMMTSTQLTQTFATLKITIPPATSVSHPSSAPITTFVSLDSTQTLFSDSSYPSSPSLVSSPKSIYKKESSQHSFSFSHSQESTSIAKYVTTTSSTTSSYLVTSQETKSKSLSFPLTVETTQSSSFPPSVQTISPSAIDTAVAFMLVLTPLVVLIALFTVLAVCVDIFKSGNSREQSQIELNNLILALRRSDGNRV